jgi:hypothetical protein
VLTLLDSAVAFLFYVAFAERFPTFVRALDGIGGFVLHRLLL